MRVLIFVVFAALTLQSCVRSYNDVGLYEKTGQMKPITIVMPVINRVEGLDLTWDVSRELTDEIRRRVFDSSKLYLLRENGSNELAKTLLVANPKEISPATLNRFGASEFVVVSELIEQNQKSYGLSMHGDKPSRADEIGAVLSLAMRVRVIDRRSVEPKVVLQEILEYDHIISKAYLSVDYVKTHWGTELYQNTPMGLAHNRLVRELVSHIEAYIVAAK
ncbi:MAG: CT253 family lipoprotein [Chlamydiales bacterium]